MIKKADKVKLPCFPAGTLVHIKDGLRPIEQIQVGDWVLSKHESGEGEREYKRVTKTFVHENAQVNLIPVRAFKPGVIDKYWKIVVTPEHPFWVIGKGWTEAKKLRMTTPDMHLESLLHERVIAGSNYPLFTTQNPDIAWAPLSASKSDLQRLGWHLNVRTLENVVERVPRPFKSVRGIAPDYIFRTTVYNIEVEDFHTYYIGEIGIWVHNKNIKTGDGAQLGAKLAAAR